MIWDKLFAKGEILTAGDRAELEAIEKKTEPYRKVRQKIDRDFIPAMHRIGHLQGLAAEYINDIGNEELYQKMVVAACMPSNIQTGYQHIEAAAGPFDAKIGEILQETIPVVRRVLQRALSAAEAELRKVEGRERKDADQDGYNYSPSGKVLALQGRVLELRNGIAAKYKFEGAIQDPAGWRERLAEWL